MRLVGDLIGNCPEAALLGCEHASPAEVPGCFFCPVPWAKNSRAGSCLSRRAAVSVYREPQEDTVPDTTSCPALLTFGWLHVKLKESGSFSRSKNSRPAGVAGSRHDCFRL